MRSSNAKVYLNGPEITTVNLLNTKGDVVDTFSLKPGPDQKIKIDGKDTKFSDFASAKRSLSGYPEDRLEAAELPGATENTWAVAPPPPRRTDSRVSIKGPARCAGPFFMQPEDFQSVGDEQLKLCREWTSFARRSAARPISGISANSATAV